MSKKVIDKLIFKYVVEIFLIIIMVVVSYTGITMNNLSQSSKIAEQYTKSSNGIQFNYERDLNGILAFEDVLDKLKLSVRNPNRETKKVSIDLIITGNEPNLEELTFKFAGQSLDIKNATKKDDKIILPLKEIELSGYDIYEENLFICGKPYTTLDFTIEFDIRESLYA